MARRPGRVPADVPARADHPHRSRPSARRVGFVVFAEPLVTLLYQQRYADATDAARLLVVGQGIHFFTLLAFTTLVAAGRNRLYPIAMLVGVVLNIALNLVLIPQYSYLGSGWATVITEVVVLVVLTLGVVRIPGRAPVPVGRARQVLRRRRADRARRAGRCSTGSRGRSAARSPRPSTSATVHLLKVNGPGGLRALAGEPP